jgi:hypothetical protein
MYALRWQGGGGGAENPVVGARGGHSEVGGRRWTLRGGRVGDGHLGVGGEILRW